MARLFEQRERAAEGLFAHDEEARFVARRHGVGKLADWAGECMALDEAGRLAYRYRLVDAFVGGTHEDEIVTIVQRDLEQAGRPTLVGQAGPVLTQAIAEAVLAAHPRPHADHGAHESTAPAAHAPKKAGFGWSL